MQTLKSICRIVQGVYSLFQSYICTPHWHRDFADGRRDSDHASEPRSQVSDSDFVADCSTGPPERQRRRSPAEATSRLTRARRESSRTLCP